MYHAFSYIGRDPNGIRYTIKHSVYICQETHYSYHQGFSSQLFYESEENSMRKTVINKIAALITCATMVNPVLIQRISANAANENIIDGTVISDFDPIMYSISSKTLNVSGVTQEKSKWCNVACAQMMLDYYYVTKSQSDIYKEAKNTTTVQNNSITSGEVKKVLNNNLSVTSFKSVTGTYASAKTRIGANCPVILNGEFVNPSDSTDHFGHAVICYGYRTDGSSIFEFYVYDPADGSSKTISTTSGNSNVFSIDRSGITYQYTVQAFIYTTSNITHR